MKTIAAESAGSKKTKGGVLGKIGVFLLLIALPARSLLGRIDHGEANVAFALCLLFGGLLGWMALLRSTATSKAWKAVLIVLPLLLVGLGMFRYRFVGFDGELSPQFRLRSDDDKSRPVSLPKSMAEKEDKPSGDNISGEFTQFLGNQRNATVEGIRLSADWTSQPPMVVWKKPIGAGWSGFAIKDDLAITIEEHAGDDCVSALKASTGELIWRTKLGRKHYHALGGAGPMATPTIIDGRAYVQSSTGIVAACDLTDGKLVWSVDLLELAKITQAEAEAAVSWGRSGSPLAVGDLLVVPFGGKSGASPASLIAFHRNDGREKWRAGKDQISYSSPSLMRLHGEEQIVIVNESSVSGHNPENGTELWQFDWPGQSNGGASVSQTILVDAERLFLSKSYHVGSMLLDFSKSLPNVTIVRTVWKNAGLMKTKFTNAVLLDGYIYGLSDGIMECIRADDGKKMWKDSRNGRFGHGQILLVDKHIVVSTEEGRCVLIEASPDKLKILGDVPVIEGTTWNPPAIVGDRVFMRNGEEAACIQVPIETP